jgi:hypothetical protein
VALTETSAAVFVVDGCGLFPPLATAMISIRPATEAAAIHAGRCFANGLACWAGTGAIGSPTGA